MADADATLWKDAAGHALSCREKVKLLDANLLEIEQICRDALDDAVLMGCSSAAFKEAVYRAIHQLEPTVKERS